MLDNIFPIFFLIGLVVGSVIRAWYGRKYRQDRTVIFREEGLAVGNLSGITNTKLERRFGQSGGFPSLIPATGTT